MWISYQCWNGRSFHDRPRVCMLLSDPCAHVVLVHQLYNDHALWTWCCLDDQPESQYSCVCHRWICQTKERNKDAFLCLFKCDCWILAYIHRRWTTGVCCCARTLRQFSLLSNQCKLIPIISDIPLFFSDNAYRRRSKSDSINCSSDKWLWLIISLKIARPLSTFSHGLSRTELERPMQSWFSG